MPFTSFTHLVNRLFEGYIIGKPSMSPRDTSLKVSIKRLCMDNVVSVDILSSLLFADWGVWIIVCYIRIHSNKL